MILTLRARCKVYNFRVDRGQSQDEEECAVSDHLRRMVVRSQVKEGRREGQSTHREADNEAVNRGGGKGSGAVGQLR